MDLKNLLCDFYENPIKQIKFFLLPIIILNLDFFFSFQVLLQIHHFFFPSNT